MLRITKELSRNDGSKIAANSIIKYDTIFVGDTMSVRYILTHWLNEEVLAEKESYQPIKQVNEFSYNQNKTCNIEEWASLDDSGSAARVENWLKEILTELLGAGNVENI